MICHGNIQPKEQGFLTITEKNDFFFKFPSLYPIFKEKNMERGRGEVKNKPTFFFTGYVLQTTVLRKPMDIIS